MRLALVGALVSAFAPAAQAGTGVFTVVPPGTGESTAECVGAPWDKTAGSEFEIMAPWNAHFKSGGVVIHDFECEH